MAKPRRLDLSWLKPPKASEDGRMALVDHLREFRYRVVVSITAIVIMSIAAWYFFQSLFDVVMWPLNRAVHAISLSRPDLQIKVSYEGIASSLLLRLEVSVIAAVIISCPVWLYQLWAFIVPGLYAREKRWALTFLGSAIPLFLTGVAVGYFIMPRGYQFMLSFVPKDSNALSLLEANNFLATEMKIVLLFGFSFLLPVVLVMLNFIGLLKGEQLRRFRKFGIFLCFVFAAVVTPSTDPFSMTALAVPMAVLYYVAEVISRRHDAHKALQADDDMVVSID
ncbi:MAG TPA: twin-arginine translocase subunit TatC [Propionibacteriaceae bacterium]|nr:twin-arginine translocase subunit TatC [Propionibacteriaceae bacterium]